MKGVEEADYAVRLAEKLGAEYAEAYVESSYGNSYALEQGVLNSSAYYEKLGLRLRILRGARLYVFSTNVLEKSNLRKAVENFRGFRGTDTRLSQEKPEKASYKVEDKVSVDTHDFLKDLVDMDKSIASKKYVKFRSLYGGGGRSKTYFTNSEGARIMADLPMVSSFMSIIVSNGTATRQRVLQFGATGGYEMMKVSDMEAQALEDSANMMKVLDKGVTLTPEQLKEIRNVVMAPEIAGIAVHESVGHPHEADRVFGREAAQAGTSYLTSKNLGLEVGSEAITLVDDPTVRNSYGFYLYDDEGVKAEPKVLVDHGKQAGLLLNREYAHVMKTRSNGSARSDSYSNEPIIRMSNTYLKPGTATFDEIISEARDGVYIKNFMEWNIDDTRSFERYQGNEAYLIKNGRIDKPVKNFVIESGTIDFWHAAKLMGNDLKRFVGNCGKGEPMQGVPVTMGGPTTLLSFRR
ncbi:MAG: TldD/PmbA family protein [Candidatus Micrarchaeota archaeon]|nr:TldD/PmbA family protein [Candidatus Micrarchaeota archaeon]